MPRKTFSAPMPDQDRIGASMRPRPDAAENGYRLIMLLKLALLQ